MECKGRVSAPSPDAKSKAKQQALRLQSVNGIAPALHLGGFVYFRNDAMQFYWKDPLPEDPVAKPVEVRTAEDSGVTTNLPAPELVRSRREIEGDAISLEDPGQSGSKGSTLILRSGPMF